MGVLECTLGPRATHPLEKITILTQRNALGSMIAAARAMNLEGHS